MYFVVKNYVQPLIFGVTLIQAPLAKASSKYMAFSTPHELYQCKSTDKFTVKNTAPKNGLLVTCLHFTKSYNTQTCPSLQKNIILNLNVCKQAVLLQCAL
jgi:hypothetical protein